ncbi:MAG: TspO/MBR family protein [Burkholderiales bacterium]|nr:tryptophan-rich sensory protein [Nitrosomonadaceae bacterium]
MSDNPVALAYGVAIATAIILAVVGGLATDVGPWYRALRKPWFQPPDWLFAPAWTVIYGCTVVAAVGAWTATPESGRGVLLAAYVVNVVLNAAWSVLFFRMKRPDWALLEVAMLWMSIVSLIFLSWGQSRTAALWLIPYIVWVSFAAWLNLAIVRLNRPFSSS